MLICPQCQFENPNTNKFCQRCGTSLTHKTCYDCDTQVPINAESCHNCGAFTGTVWWAIISQDLDALSLVTPSGVAPQAVSELETSNVSLVQESQNSVPLAVERDRSPAETPPSGKKQVPDSSSDPPSLELDPPEAAQSLDPSEASSEEPTIEAEAAWETEDLESKASVSLNAQSTSSPLQEVIYLDPQQRYRLLESLTPEKTGAGVDLGYGIAVRVLDCQPFQKSLLQALIEQQSDEIYPQSSHILGIPAIAQPYLALKSSYYPTVPNVHDAWQQEGEAVILLEDRSEWQLLSDLWDSEELSTLQILYWLDEIAQLWQALESWHCRQSLLEITNLRVDEDQVLGLVCLYPEPKDQQLSLEDLGQMWRRLFNNSQRTQLTSLGAVFRQLCTHEITTVQELRTQLEVIAQAEELSNYQEAALMNDDLSTPTHSGMNSSPSALKEDSTGNPDDGGPTVILPMQLLSLDDVGCTDIGHQRDHNEDCFGIQTLVKRQENPMGRTLEGRGLYILCDGMGGHAAGEVASSMAVETLKRYFQENWQDQLPPEESIREAVRLANQEIYDVNQQNSWSGSGRMGTTLAMILIQNTTAVIAHVGDSRLYRLTRKGGLEQLTVDHEVGQREIKRGVESAIAYSRPDAYQLTQALGPRSEQFVNPDVKFLELNEDTLFVLCSDGLSDNELIEDHWQTHLAPLLSSRANLEQGIFQLIELANEHNGHDNITAILIRVKVRPNFQKQRW